LAEFGTKKDSSPTDENDYNIYGIIAGSIAGLMCATALGIGAIKKFYGEEELLDELTKNNQIQPEPTQ
jgi:hypothetical protein